MARTRSLGWYAIAWIEHHLVHGPGDVQGEPIELDDEFAAFLLKAYEVTARGERKVRRAFLSRAKGRAKSELASMMVCFEALGECRFDHWAAAGETSDWGYEFEPGEPVGRQLTYVEVLNVATEEGQAGHTYNGVYFMLHPDTCSPVLLERFGPIDVGLTRTFLPGRRGFIEPVSASNESKDGAKSTFIVADESHLWIPPVNGVFKLGRMHQTMVRNLLKRKESSGWMLETSTMYAKGENSVAEGTHAFARSLKSAGRGDAALLFDHRQAGEHWDLTNRAERIKALREAYGPAADWMNLSAIADYWDDPQASENEFRRFWLNQPVRLVNPLAIDPVQWLTLEDREAAQPDRVALVVAVSSQRERACIGIAGDIAGSRTLVMTDSGRGVGWVADKVAQLVADRQIAEVGLATGEARALQPELVRRGIEFDAKGIGRRLTEPDMTASCGAFQAGVKAGMVVHVGQPELREAVGSARTRPIGGAAKAETWDGDAKVEVIAAAAAFYRWGLLAVEPYDVLASVFV
ncbi:hypothetical protein [Mycobacterium sp.]|uniref:hypothetical protein n=1 Tax=Mycobacterium sp. TaxID=1785 RepID=UPI003F95CE5C